LFKGPVSVPTALQYGFATVFLLKYFEIVGRELFGRINDLSVARPLMLVYA